MRKHFILVNENVKQYAIQQIQSLPIDADKPLVIEVKEKTRSLDQNAKLWATLTDISEQIEWYGKKFNPEDWKHIFSASLSKQEVVPGLDGDFIVLGKSTSKMTITQMRDLIELAQAFGAERGVIFND